MLSVLLVDDDADLLEMVEMVLRHSEMNVESADSGAAFLDSLSITVPDIVVMDIYLGDADGRSLCQQFKASDKFKDIPVILYSAGVIPRQSITDAGADDFIVKPFGIDELIDKIKQLTAAA